MDSSQFHPACHNWFKSRFDQPTAAQAQAWPAIRAGRHTLICAPTGSGKTLAAFYAAIDSLIRVGVDGQLGVGVQVLYISPLKALSNDIHKNLELPLDGIAEQLHLCGEAPVDIRIAVRTGDTPAAARQKMARNPPHILVTTPESLYLLLSSASGRAMLASVSTLIIDEIHAMLGDKRGSHLSLSVERLQHLVLAHSGQTLQRIGLSATQKPIEMVARYLVGNRNYNEGNVDCEIVDVGFRRQIDVSLEVPRSPLSALMSNEVWDELYQRLVDLINTHATTLVFVNTRRLSERLALALAERLGENAVCSHHGSMSKEHRHQAEQRLKAGELKVLVATASMELGIDVGAIDLVVQFSSPKSIASFIQRVGRSGHTIDGIPKGILFPLTRDDLVEATALLHSIKQGELDRIVMPEKPMDILSQQIVAELSTQSLTASAEPDGWDVNALFELFANAYPYRDLDREEFDTIVKMLAVGYASRRGRRGTLLHYDAINNRLRARRGANLIALTNGGAIPDMFDYQVVLDPEDVVVGSLNEDFALEALPGDVFVLGTHAWQLLRIDGLKVRVRDAQGMHPTIPFWFGEGLGRTRELSESVSRLRQCVADLLLDDSANAAVQWVVDAADLPRDAATQLVEYLQAGMNALGVMPSRETIVMERFFDEIGDMHVVIHSPYGSRLNRAWGLALRKRFCRSFNFELQAAANEDSIVISLGSVHSFPLADVYKYLQSETVRDVLVQALLDATMFEVRWRWNATRSLAIQRNRNGKRVPPQFQRMDAEDLIAHVFPDQIACQENLGGRREVPDHPLVNQTIHDCLTEAMDIDELTQLITRIEQDQLTLIAKDLREPSPFAQEIINARPYAFLDDAPFEERRTNAIRNRSWADPAETPDLSLLDAGAIERVKAEAWPGVSNSEELHDAILGLAYVTTAEFASHQYAQWQQALIAAGRIELLDLPGFQLWIATENLPVFMAVYKDMHSAVYDAAVYEDMHSTVYDAVYEPVYEDMHRGVQARSSLPGFLRDQHWERSDALREILRGRLEGMGPVTVAKLSSELHLEESSIGAALTALEVEGYAFQGRFSPPTSADGEAVEWCERRLLQRIHRYSIDAHRKSITPVSLQTYIEFLFDRHQLLPLTQDEISAPASLDGQTQLQNTLSLLDGIPAPAASWEADLYPVRIKDYDPSWLDAMCISGRVAWGRYTLPAASLRESKSNSRKSPGPIKTTPITVVLRQNLDIWQALANSQLPEETQLQYSASASRIESDLEQHGASFFDQIQSRTGLLKTQLEEGLAELVAGGRLSSDSFTGLRALLTPGSRKRGSHRRRGRKAMFGVEDAGRWSLLDTFSQAAKPAEQASRYWNVLDEEQLQRLAGVYLLRWGVLFRNLLDRESKAPPWRVLLASLRKMELRGTIRGGRFISGVSGEQFAFSETVDALRQFRKGQEKRADQTWICIAATDPLNLINLSLPKRKLPRLGKNRVLYRNGIAVAVLESGDVHFLTEVDPDRRWLLQQMLLKRKFPTRLRSYLGK